MPRNKQQKNEETNHEDNPQEKDEEVRGKAHPLEPDPDINTNQEHPDPPTDFANLLMTYGVPDNKARTIVKNMVNTGSPDVFFNVPELMVKLTAFPMWVPPTTRKLVMDEWIAVNKIAIPENYEDLMTSPRTTPQTVKRAEELKKKITEGAVWTIDTDANGNFKPRLITDPGETGDTLANIKEAIKMMVKESGSDEMLVVFDETIEKWRPNYKSALVQKNLSAAIAAAKQMNNDVAQGKPANPWDEWTEQVARQQMMREVLSLPQQNNPPGSNVSDTIAAFKELVALQGGSSGLPDWIKDPAQARKVLLAEDGGESSAIKELRASIEQMRVDQQANETARLNATITALTTQVESYKNEVASYKDELAKNQKVTGKTIYDLVGVGVDRIPRTSEILEGLKQITQNPPKIPVGGPGDVSKRLESAAGKLEEAGKLKKAGDVWFNLG